MKAAVVVGLAALLAVLAAMFALMGLDVVVRVALERWGPDVTGVKVDVERVSLSAFDGKGFVQGLELGAPAGFSSRAAHFGAISVRLDPGTVLDDVVVIRELAVRDVSVAYERGDRSSNLDAIQRSIEAYARASGASAAKGRADGTSRTKRRFVIERLSIRKARVVMTTRGLRGQGLVFDLPDVELRDVGKGSGGVTASEAAGVVASALQQKIALRVLTNVDALRRGGLEGALDALRGLIK